ncbi:facilitated trehalose transporter Tret1-like [Diabrotica virgifera virgifera]|uniref:Major facilitator superfamily (MFS) profile domain-containing protein n=2 Tax=Diabrotica virgifera virgifera TaxID=50390 RepID=A0ABM5KBC6_DIAVI|nr:facilitated trehalose transporter Tret1-like [Diabrotica virgifera virgifera]
MANTAILSGIVTGCLLMALTILSQMSIMFAIRYHRGHVQFPVHMINWLFVTLGIGNIFGSVVFSFLAEKVGRKHTLTALGVQFGLSFFMSELSIHSAVLFISKFIAGLSVGGTYVVVPIYIGEVAEKTSRGRLIALMYPSLAIANFFVIGFLEPLGGYGLSSILNYISASVAIIATILSVTLVEESPFYYLTIGRELAAKSSLVKLRSNHSNHQMEFNEIQNKVQPDIPDIEVGEKVSTFVKYSWLKPLLLMTGILGLRSLSGLSSSNFFMTHILQSGDWDWKLIMILFSAVHLLGSFVILFIIDKYGRKLPLIVSVILMSVLYIFLFVLVLMDRHGIHNYISPYLLSAVSILSYLAVDIGVGPIPFVLLGELFPLRNKMMCAGISMALHFILTLLLPIIMIGINHSGPGPYINIIISIAVAISLVILVKYYYPETKDKSLNEIQVEINKNSPPSNNSPILTK